MSLRANAAVKKAFSGSFTACCFNSPTVLIERTILNVSLNVSAKGLNTMSNGLMRLRRGPM